MSLSQKFFKAAKVACVAAAITIGISSCSRGITVQQAANGKAKCGRHLR